MTREVARIQASGKPLPKESKYVDIYREKPIRVAVKVLVPIKEHPKVRFSYSNLIYCRLGIQGKQSWAAFIRL